MMPALRPVLAAVLDPLAWAGVWNSLLFSAPRAARACVYGLQMLRSLMQGFPGGITALPNDEQWTAQRSQGSTCVGARSCGWGLCCSVLGPGCGAVAPPDRLQRSAQPFRGPELLRLRNAVLHRLLAPSPGPPLHPLPLSSLLPRDRAGDCGALDLPRGWHRCFATALAVSAAAFPRPPAAGS